jgi:glycosyltransferase involved in cell wall biosynthesis
MKIGIEFRPVVPTQAGPLPRLYRGLLAALFAHHPEHDWWVFTTVLNRALVPGEPARGRVVTLPAGTAAYHADLDHHARNLPGLDVLFRAAADEALRFPFDHQVFLLEDLDHERHPELFSPAELRRRRLALHLLLLRAGGLGVLSEQDRQLLQQHDYNTGTPELFVLPPAPAEGEGPAAWAALAAALVAALERVGQGQRKGVASIRVQSPPLVSIVTPSYNQGRFLRRTIESVLQQTYPHIEYRVCDGGSTDDSVAILKSYGDRIWWVSEKDRGQSHAINKGLAHARGEILAYLNSDDVLLPRAVEQAVGWFQERPHCDVVYGDAYYTDEEDRLLEPYPTEDYSFEKLLEICYICQPATFWRARIARRVGPFDESLDYTMDYDYWLRIDRAGGVIEYLDEVLAYTRFYRQAKSSAGCSQQLRECFEVCHRSGGKLVRRHLQVLWDVFCQRLGLYHPHSPPWVPRLHKTLAAVHFAWLSLRSRPLARTLARARHRLLRHLEQTGWPAKVVYGPLMAAINVVRRGFRPVLYRPHPEGFLPNNKVGPRATVTLPAAAAGRHLYLAGTASLDTELVVRINGRPAARRALTAGQPVRVELDVPALPGQRVSLRFSRYLCDLWGRRHSFVLEDTNLLEEHDLAA